MIPESVSCIAIVGLGSIGRRHLKVVKAFRPELKIVLVRSGHGNNWSEQNLADYIVFSVKEALEIGVQAAIIANPSSSHIHTALAFVKSGVHVLIEKPLSNNMDGLDQLINEVTEHRVVGLVGYVLRYRDDAEKFYQLLQSVDLGKRLYSQVECSSYLPDWRPDDDFRNSVSSSEKLGGGVLLELSHELDYIRWFFGEMFSVQSHLQNTGTLGIDVEDCADLIITNSVGMPINLHLDFVSKTSSRNCSIVGTKGSIKWDAVERTVECLIGSYPKESWSFKSGGNDMYSKQFHHFMDCINGNETPKVPISDGVAVMRIIDETRKANGIGRRIQEI